MRDDPADPATEVSTITTTAINEDFLMPAVNTKQIQELRRRTGAGMLHCKSTLEATKGILVLLAAFGMFAVFVVELDKSLKPLVKFWKGL